MVDYTPFKNAIVENKQKKHIVKASEWNELFNILATQANYLDDNMKNLHNLLNEFLNNEEVFTGIPLHEEDPEDGPQLYFKIKEIR
jgi:hypothetical protein